MLSVIAMETIAFLGCSKGLGKAVALAYCQQNPDIQALLISRKENLLKELGTQLKCPVKTATVDFSKGESVEIFLNNAPTLKRIFYFAGGGPYGDYGSKEWKDHQWSFQVNFLTPAKIIHHYLQKKEKLQIVVVGSAIADEKADPGAASYAAGKHALKGLVDSIQGENPTLDLRIFRPGYLDTDLLPPQAKPRKEGKIILTPDEAAQIFVSWALDPQGVKSLNLEAPG